MSERQAKKIRKQGVAEPQKKKADKSKVIFNIIAVVLILAVAALAAYAISKEIKPQQETNVTETNIDTSTLAGYAESMGMTFEEMVTNYGLNTEIFTDDMSSEEASKLFTLENIAAMSEKDIETFKTELGLPADVDTTVANSELSAEVMMKVNGYPYTVEDLREYGLSADITGETRWADAMDAVNEAANARYTAESAAAETADTEGAAADGGAE